MRKYIEDFVNEENGIETLELIGTLAVAAALIYVCVRVARKIKTKAKGLADGI